MADVEIVNTDQAAAWDGHEGDVWTEQADRYDRAGDRIWRRFLEAEPVASADRVIDIGCGTGRGTLDVARVASRGTAMGIDLSTRMLDLARKRAADAGVVNATFVRGDAQVFAFEPGETDVVVSSFGAMFFNDPIEAFTNIGRALRSGGSLQMLAWRSLPDNEWLTAFRSALAVGRTLPTPPPDAPTPFSLADPDRVRRVLDSAGFAAPTFDEVRATVYYGSDVEAALEFVSRFAIVQDTVARLDVRRRERTLDRLRRLLAAHRRADGVWFDSRSWIVAARRS